MISNNDTNRWLTQVFNNATEVRMCFHGYHLHMRQWTRAQNIKLEEIAIWNKQSDSLCFRLHAYWTNHLQPVWNRGGKLGYSDQDTIFTSKGRRKKLAPSRMISYLPTSLWWSACYRGNVLSNFISGHSYLLFYLSFQLNLVPAWFFPCLFFSKTNSTNLRASPGDSSYPS